MVDTFSKNERSEIMRSVKSKGNKSTELKLISFFRLHKITGWRRNIKLIGKPDFVFKILKQYIGIKMRCFHTLSRISPEKDNRIICS